MKEALLIVDHGSRRSEANESLLSIAALVRELRPDLIVHIAHMSIAEPDIAAGFAACVKDGAKHVKVHPYMLSPGSHAKEDIPNLTAAAAANHPGTSFQVSEPLGIHGKLAELILERTELAPPADASRDFTSPVITHIALHVDRLNESIEFYGDFCGMNVVHERTSGDKRIVWMAEPGREKEFIFVLMPGGRSVEQAHDDYSHLGFALKSRAAVDAVAEKARAAGLLFWEPREEPYPVGYYCGVRDPSGAVVEFSHGQPLGPGAEDYRTS